MKEQCTIGILIDLILKEVVLIKKIKPKWQNGKWNFPGGHTEMGETSYECVSREFKEETGVFIPPENWECIGLIHDGNYEVDILTSNLLAGKEPKTTTKEEIKVFKFYDLPLHEEIISNLAWLIPMAFNFWENIENENTNFAFGMFNYKSKP